MQQLDLNLLLALDALLEHASVVGAADQLGLSASAMSRTLARIRRQTGDPILVRAGRGLVPTPHALALRERVRAAVLEARSLLGPGGERALQDVRRVITIRADDAVAAVVGPALLERMGSHAPGVSIVFRPEGDEDVASLRDGRVDLDIGVQGALGPEVRVRKLFEDERVVLVRGRVRRRARPMALEAYARAEHIDVSRRGLLRGPVDDHLERQGLARRVRCVVANQLTAAVLVARSEAISLVSAHFATAVEQILEVHALRPPAPLEKVAVSLAWHPRFDGDDTHAWLREQLRDIVASIRSGTPRSG